MTDRRESWREYSYQFDWASDAFAFDGIAHVDHTIASC